MDALLKTEDSYDTAVAAPSAGERLRRQIEGREATIGIIGLGYVGLPLVPAVAAAGYDVIGFDIDDAKIEAIRAGQSYIKHIPSNTIRALTDEGRFTATSDMSRLAAADTRESPRSRRWASARSPPYRARFPTCASARADSFRRSRARCGW